MDPFAYAVEVVLRLTAAAVSGAVIGWNREREDKPAGLRTHMLVSIGAAGFTLAMLDLIRRYPSPTGSDATRIIQGIPTGIGFLGAGTILREGPSVRGITTAAGIWVVGAIGIACGAGSYLIGGVMVALTFATLTAVRRIERRVQK